MKKLKLKEKKKPMMKLPRNQKLDHECLNCHKNHTKKEKAHGWIPKKTRESVNRESIFPKSDPECLNLMFSGKEDYARTFQTYTLKKEKQMSERA